MLIDALVVLASLAVALVVALPLGRALKRWPAVFYAVAAVAVGLYLWGFYQGFFVGAWQHLGEPLRKGYIATFLLALVMVTGALPEKSALRRRLQPVRAELSILSFVLYIAHVGTFLPLYLPRLGALVSIGNLMSASIVVALVLTGVYALLSVLSLRGVRVRMPYRVWKGIQRLSYVMVALLLLHVWLAVGRSALFGAAPTTRVSLVLYSVLVVGYAVLRIRKALHDRASRREACCGTEALAV